ncbi:MAG: GGDEF domain-containing protein [Magnetococcus sp. WYHC-3]
MLDSNYAEALIDLTRQGERSGLIRSLIGALEQLIPAPHVMFYDLIQESYFDPAARQRQELNLALDALDDHAEPLPFERIPGLQLCLNRVEPTFLRSDTGACHRLLYPMVCCDLVHSVLEIELSRYDAEVLSRIHLLSEVFVNLQETLRKKNQDPLTGLLNRRSFDETVATILEELTRRSFGKRRPGDGACLAAFDLDHFKRVNDTYGHAIGDEVLILFSRLLEKVFRRNDYLFRFGGEEFIAILLDVDPDKAAAALERLRQRVASFDFPQVGHVTVSCGYVMVNGQDFPTELLEKADKALYFAKNNGRNQVCWYENLVDQNQIASIDHDDTDVELWV